ncbi:hypothetical protein [uncultured Chryseobacterium sp.]|uniref:hypothetical protein n=1 Tax=uncultured Chryseobacterium sp. TaxID=259322 RepID=UPI0025DC21E1|nr:hypothetical protein [uncultured Chryseobacterium sp.]
MKPNSLKPTTTTKGDHSLKKSEALEALKDMYRKNREEQKRILEKENNELIKYLKATGRQPKEIQNNLRGSSMDSESRQKNAVL